MNVRSPIPEIGINRGLADKLKTEFNFSAPTLPCPHFVILCGEYEKPLQAVKAENFTHTFFNEQQNSKRSVLIEWKKL